MCPAHPQIAMAQPQQIDSKVAAATAVTEGVIDVIITGFGEFAGSVSASPCFVVH
jgi:hypothetical protein